jgi:hypothetical protein
MRPVSSRELKGGTIIASVGVEEFIYTSGVEDENVGPYHTFSFRYTESHTT